MKPAVELSLLKIVPPEKFERVKNMIDRAFDLHGATITEVSLIQHVEHGPCIYAVGWGGISQYDAVVKLEGI